MCFCHATMTQCPPPACGEAATYVAASTSVAARSAAESTNLLLCRPHPFPRVLSPHTVLIKKASFNWKALASQNPRRGRNARRTARKASATDTADTQQSAQQAAAGADAAAVADSTTDGTVAAAAGSSGSSTVGIASHRAALRAAAAAGMPTSTASRMRVANPELAATLGSGTAAAAAGSGTAAVGPAATPAAGSTGATAAAPSAASAVDTTAKAAEAAYDKSGLADAKFLLPVGPEVSGQLASRDTSPALSNCMCVQHALFALLAALACINCLSVASLRFAAVFLTAVGRLLAFGHRQWRVWHI